MGFNTAHCQCHLVTILVGRHDLCFPLVVTICITYEAVSSRRCLILMSGLLYNNDEITSCEKGLSSKGLFQVM